MIRIPIAVHRQGNTSLLRIANRIVQQTHQNISDLINIADQIVCYIFTKLYKELYRLILIGKLLQCKLRHIRYQIRDCVITLLQLKTSRFQFGKQYNIIDTRQDIISDIIDTADILSIWRILIYHMQKFICLHHHRMNWCLDLITHVC